jgi:nucleoside-diphosphate-sugar epimerase
MAFTKILITGGAGYIGSVLINELVKEVNNKITVVDKLIFEKNSLKFLIDSKKINFFNYDVRDYNKMKDLFVNNDIIIPLAALVGAPLCEKFQREAVEINQDAIRFLVENSSKEQKIIFPVTNSGYGIGEANKSCDENSPLNPISLYGKTKVQAEKFILSKENTICFRLATVFGVSPRMRIDLLVNNFVLIALKKKYLKLYEPHFRRNYIHIKDVVDAIIFAINNFEILKNETYNLGLSEANLTKENLCKEIQKVIKDFIYEIGYDQEDQDKRDYFVSNEKIEKKGFKALRSLSSGIKELVDFYNQNDSMLEDNISKIKL